MYVTADIDEALLHKNSINNVLINGLLSFKINGRSEKLGKLVPSFLSLSGITINPISAVIGRTIIKK